MQTLYDVPGGGCPLKKLEKVGRQGAWKGGAGACRILSRAIRAVLSVPEQAKM
jgi:hypothetical protein